MNIWQSNTAWSRCQLLCSLTSRGKLRSRTLAWSRKTLSRQTSAFCSMQSESVNSSPNMSDNSRDIVIIGGGHNGLVTAFYLAKAGLKPLVLEQRNIVGGAAITEEFHPGFKCSTLSHSAGPLRPEIIRDMELAQHGLKLITPEIGAVALSPDGRALVLYDDARRTAQEISKFSQNDAVGYPEFQHSLQKIGRVIGEALKLAPPNI